MLKGGAKERRTIERRDKEWWKNQESILARQL